MLSKTSIRPLHTKTSSSTRLWRATGTSFSTFGSGSKSWCRLRKTKTPASRKTMTARVNPTRSAGTPAGSITAIWAKLFVIMRASYRCFQSVAPTHVWDFPMPPKNGSRVPLQRERSQFLIAFCGENGLRIRAKLKESSAPHHRRRAGLRRS
jgi:hypothetical protein